MPVASSLRPDSRWPSDNCSCHLYATYNGVRRSERQLQALLLTTPTRSVAVAAHRQFFTKVSYPDRRSSLEGSRRFSRDIVAGDLRHDASGFLAGHELIVGRGIDLSITVRPSLLPPNRRFLRSRTRVPTALARCRGAEGPARGKRRAAGGKCRKTLGQNGSLPAFLDVAAPRRSPPGSPASMRPVSRAS